VPGGNIEEDGFSVWVGFRMDAGQMMKEGGATFPSDAEADEEMALKAGQLMAECIAGMLRSDKGERKNAKNALKNGRMMRALNIINNGTDS